MPSPGDAPDPRHGRADEGAPGAPPPDIYQLIVDSVRDYAIFALDPKGRVMTWNPGAAALKGYRANEIIGRHFSRFYPDEDVARGKPAHELTVATEYGRFEDEGWRLRADGSRFWANVVITAIRRRGSDKLVGFSKVTRDLTERRQAEEALRRSEERFRLLVEGVQDYAILLLDPAGHIQSWNQGAERLNGYRAGEIVGEHISRFYLPEDIALKKPEIELETAARTGRYEDEGWRLRKDGTRFWTNVVVTALRDPRDGKLMGYSKVTRDLTERRRSEQALRQAYRDLEAFSFTVSHDLRAPLRSIIALSEAALAEPLSTDGRTHVEAIRRSALEGASLAQNLLRFSRASAADLRDEAVDLAALARDVGARLAETAKHKVQLVVKDAPEMRVRGDPPLLRIALENLLSNAWKFTQGAREARVEFSVSRGERGVPVFVVRDNGAGFDPARAKALFEPFHRLHTQAEFPGTGVGLATVQRIVRRHGGQLWADARPGEGATFSFTLHDPTVADQPGA